MYYQVEHCWGVFETKKEFYGMMILTFLCLKKNGDIQ